VAEREAFDEACGLIEQMLAGTARQDLVWDLEKSREYSRALLRLRERMRTHTWPVGRIEVSLARFIRKFDGQTRQEGFHALNDWDGKADRVNDEIIPVDVLDYILRRCGDRPLDPAALSILVDYYFMHVLSLLTLRVWDEGDADENLQRVSALLALLQGPHGSGQPFAADAETLLLIATSHYEREEGGYGLLLQRVRSLGNAHQVAVALGHAASMGCHLRFGFEATYGRDTILMRNDNVADYPWLCYAVTTLMREYARLRSDGGAAARCEPLVEALLNGLSPDARALVGEPPPSLSAFEVERGEFRSLFLEHRDDLLARFESFAPTDTSYSPLSFFFNFSHNVLKGTVVDALLRGTAWRLSFNQLLTARQGDGGAKTRLATTLMGYARQNPDRIRGRWMPVIVYDPRAGRRAFKVAMSKLARGES